MLDRPVAPADLPDLRRLQRAVVRAAESVLAGEAPDCVEINTLAAGSSARVELAVTEGVAHRRLVWTDPSPAALLARGLVEELAALDGARLRRCARPECDLLFHDTMRSRTRRWHTEDPCVGANARRVHRRSRREDLTDRGRPATGRGARCGAPRGSAPPWRGAGSAG